MPFENSKSFTRLAHFPLCLVENERIVNKPFTLDQTYLFIKMDLIIDHNIRPSFQFGSYSTMNSTSYNLKPMYASNTNSIGVTFI